MRCEACGGHVVFDGQRYEAFCSRCGLVAEEVYIAPETHGHLFDRPGDLRGGMSKFEPRMGHPEERPVARRLTRISARAQTREERHLVRLRNEADRRLGQLEIDDSRIRARLIGVVERLASFFEDEQVIGGEPRKHYFSVRRTVEVALILTLREFGIAYDYLPFISHKTDKMRLFAAASALGIVFTAQSAEEWLNLLTQKYSDAPLDALVQARAFLRDPALTDGLRPRALAAAVLFVVYPPKRRPSQKAFADGCGTSAVTLRSYVRRVEAWFLATNA